MNRFFNIRTGLIAGFVLLVVLAIALVYQIVAPSLTKTGNVSTYKVFSDGTHINVPTVITAGEPFIYSATGTKLISAGAEIKTQLTCRLDNGSDSIVQIGEIYSNAPEGPINIKRSIVVPNNQRLQASDRCYLEYFGIYNFYTTTVAGIEAVVPIPAVVRSNDFKLIVPVL